MIVLSYPQYCRYRSMLKRIQDKPSSILTDQFALALGGIAVVSKNPQILYCRDTFDHPTLIENESICDEFGESFHDIFFILHETCACVAGCFQFLLGAVVGNGADFHKPGVPPPPPSSPSDCGNKTSLPPWQPLFPRAQDYYLEFVVQDRV